MLAEVGDPELTRIFQYVPTSAFAGAERHSRCLAAAHLRSSGASSLAAATELPVAFTEVLAHLPCQPASVMDEATFQHLSQADNS